MKETRAEILQSWIGQRKESGQEPYLVSFSISCPSVNPERFPLQKETLKKIETILEKHNVGFGFVDTLAGAYNLNRDWLETDPIECYVEFCGVYPIHWDINDVVEFERMENDGEIIVMAYWHKDGKMEPNH